LYNNLIERLNNSSINKYLDVKHSTSSIPSSTSLPLDAPSHSNITALPPVEENVEFNINIKNILFYTGLGVVLYFIYYIPGPSIPVDEITQYNFINQCFINTKILIKDLYNSFFGNGPADPKGKGPDLGNLDTELSDLGATGSRSVDSHSPSPNNTPGGPVGDQEATSTPINNSRDVAKVVTTPLIFK
jgi:hypothetical protein